MLHFPYYDSAIAGFVIRGKIIREDGHPSAASPHPPSGIPEPGS